MACGKYKARVVDVYSGDDLLLMVDLGVDGLFKQVRARLHGVDAPNAFREREGSEAYVVRDEVKNILENQVVQIDIHHEGRGGWVVELWYLDALQVHRSLNSFLQKRGYIYNSIKGKTDASS